MSGAFTNNDNANVPWSSISGNNETFLDHSSLPADVQLKEPTKLKMFHITQLWQHWRKRMLENQEGLVFIKGRKADILPPKEKLKGKGKQSDYIELSENGDSNAEKTQGNETVEEEGRTSGNSGLRDPGPSM